MTAHNASLPTADDFARDAVRRHRRLLLTTIVLATICGFSVTIMGADSPILPLVVLILAITPVLLWRYPLLALYIPVASSCLFELLPTKYKDALTDRIPFYWNINTILQTYGHINFKAVPLNLFEVFLIVVGLMSLVRAVYYKNLQVRGGPLIIPIALYIGFVVWACINGLASGGDFKLALVECRSQFYFIIAYLMGINLIKSREQAVGLLWVIVGCVGFKGLLYTFRRYVTLHGFSLPDQGVGSHEEAFFFDGYVNLLIVNTLCALHPKMRRLMWLLLPLVVLGNIATNRRAGTAAMAIAIPILLLAAYRCLPERRKAIALFASAVAVIGPVYVIAFMNSESAIAQPARAIKSQFHPDIRDASSNLYRDQENICVITTIKAAPVQGYGYGRRFIHAVKMDDISAAYEWWDLIPHNNVLWIWMRVGTVGYVAFWMMISAIVVHLCRQLRREDNEMDQMKRGFLLFTLTQVAMVLVFGLLDLQLSNFRDMSYVGFWIGITCAVVKLPEQVLGAHARRLGHAGQGRP